MVRKIEPIISPKKIKGIVVFYRNIGQIPSDGVEDFLKKCVKNNADLIANLEYTGYDVIFIPNRNGTNRVELLQL